MKEKFWLCKRGNIYVCFDSETGKRESLRSRNKEEAKRIIQAKNSAARQPAMNIAIAKAYLVGADPKLMERTWTFVMDQFCAKGKESTRQRQCRAVKSKAFDPIRHKKLIETSSEDFMAVFNSSGSYANHILRCLHNLALGMGWLLSPVIAPKLWPKIEKRPKRAITFEEHFRIVQAEQNPEKRSYYELLWEIGAAQTDAANLSALNVDWENRRLSFRRQKTGELCVMEVGPRLENLLRSLPENGPFFPKISQLADKWRAAEFYRRCKVLKIEGISLHSYRYAWASRAKQAGMPERFAQSALGHASLAVHREYARDGVVTCPSLEEYEQKIVRLPEANAHRLVTIGEQIAQQPQ